MEPSQSARKSKRTRGKQKQKSDGTGKKLELSGRDEPAGFEDGVVTQALDTPSSKSDRISSSSVVHFDNEVPRDITFDPITHPSSESAGFANDKTLEIDDSENEAPESVTTTAAVARSKAAAVSAAKAAHQQIRFAKEKRQKLAARLKVQSESRRTLKNEKSPANLATEAETEASDISPTGPNPEATIGENVRPRKKPKKMTVPDLLPDDVLAREPIRISPTLPPPSQRNAERQAANHRRLHANENPKKDLVFGPVTVSVLDKVDLLLPPKSTARSKLIKESWLLGRREKKGVVPFERKKQNQGFVRG